MTSAAPEDWSAWSATAETPAEVSDNYQVSTALQEPEEVDPSDLEGLPLPPGENMPDSGDLLATLATVEAVEEAIQSAKLQHSENFPDLPDETLSVVGEVERQRTTIEGMQHRIDEIAKQVLGVLTLTNQIISLEKQVSGFDAAVTTLSGQVNRVKTELSALSNNLTAAVAASERKVLAAVGSVAPALKISTVEPVPPSSITLPALVLPEDTQARAMQAMLQIPDEKAGAPIRAHKVRVDNW